MEKTAEQGGNVSARSSAVSKKKSKATKSRKSSKSNASDAVSM